jgi:hypothetical protein
MRSFKPHNWLGHKSFKSHTFNACKWPRLAKNKTFSQNKPVESTDYETGLHAKRKLKYSRNEHFDLLHYVKWNRIVTLAGVQVIPIHNVVIGIINEPRKHENSDFKLDILEFNFLFAYVFITYYSLQFLSRELLLVRHDILHGRSLSIYGSECQIWKTFTTMLKALSVVGFPL